MRLRAAQRIFITCKLFTKRYNGNFYDADILTSLSQRALYSAFHEGEVALVPESGPPIGTIEPLPSALL